MKWLPRYCLWQGWGQTLAMPIPLHGGIVAYTLWLFNIAMVHGIDGPFIDDCPS